MSYFNRTLEEHIKPWCKAPKRKFVFLAGPPHVGKSLLAQKIGYLYFPGKTITVDCSKTIEVEFVFGNSTNLGGILSALGKKNSCKIVPGEYLLIFENIHAHGDSLRQIKYVCEQYEQLNIIVTGTHTESLTGRLESVAGSVITQMVRPLNFQEFLRARGEAQLAEIILEEPQALPTDHQKIIKELCNYLLVGGMPDVIKVFNERGDFSSVHIRQLELADYITRFDYGGGFTQKNIKKLLSEIKFKSGSILYFDKIIEGMSMPQVKKLLDRLITAGVLHRNNPTTPDIYGTINPKLKGFKLVIADLGISRGLSEESTGDMKGLYDPLKDRTLLQSYVSQELVITQPHDLYFWGNGVEGSTAFIDFLTDVERQKFPIQIRSDRQEDFYFSYDVYKTIFKRVPPCLVFSSQPYSQQRSGDIIELPLYYASKITGGFKSSF
jgi:predicted AAA+ superfamily ATPase